MVPVNVFLTVDVECSIGGAFSDADLKPVGSEKRIFGRFPGRELGIPLMMNIAEQYHLPLIFFVETFHQHFFGPQETRSVVETILNRGHDIQLHLHPCFLNFTLENLRRLQFSDFCASYPLEKQVGMIAEARKRLTDSGAPSPLAFRAGCFGANLDTLQALKANGFIIDSSYNQAYLNNTCLLPDLQLNDLAECSGIFEFPISQFWENSGLRASRSMHLDINGSTFEEMRYVLNASRSHKGPRNVTILLHSFSFIKPYDVQYNRIRPRWNVIRRFEKLCRFLKKNERDFQVRVFKDLSRNELVGMMQERCDDAPSMPAHLSWARFSGQLFDRWV